jgi:8-oxo-dGTP diphosphatase
MSVVRTPVDVAVGVLLRPDGRFLLASRPLGKPYAGYWEFPGGKIERGESVATALVRELHEELGIELGAVHPWVVREFDYPHARVRLHFCRVFDWIGAPVPRESQHLQFCTLDELPDGPLLPATIPVLQWLTLPARYAVSNAAELGPGEFLRRLDRRLRQGERMILWREPDLGAAENQTVFDATLRRARAAGARVLVSSRHPTEWWDRADGVQLTANDLLRCTARPAHAWVAASVHSRRELDQAIGLGLDFAVAGAIKPTRSHPGVRPIGWNGFADIATASSIPVYAIGGLVDIDLAAARASGAHGVALRSAAWFDD